MSLLVFSSKGWLDATQANAELLQDGVGRRWKGGREMFFA